MIIKIGRRSLASFEFHLQWSSPEANHREVLFAPLANIWRDLFPLDGKEQLLGRSSGEKVTMSTGPDRGIPVFSPEDVRTIGKDGFLRRRIHGREVKPRFGRFYPRGLLLGFPGVFPQDVRPFRCVGTSGENLNIDLNHPMADRNGELEVRVVDVWEKDREMGGQCRVWMEDLLSGPGMQARWKDQPTDFCDESGFARADETEDAGFYAQPRPVTHVDSQARRHVREIYSRLVSPGMHVLDLMSSIHSHLPDDLAPAEVVGLGLNEEELQANPALNTWIVHDLNAAPVLPFAADSFDIVVCSLSVEYLVNPVEVFSDVARVLRPGGVFVTTFSNRWFPPKVIRIWTELHEFERMGLVLEFFLRSRRFTDLHTLSLRGWPRPMDERDRYYPVIQDSDPIHAVWGRVRESA